MGDKLIPFLSFVIVTTFTPGPNNMSSTSMGIRYGYKNTLNYLWGIGTGFFLVMLICGFLSTTLLRVFPQFEHVLRIIGALYILWIAVTTVRETYNFHEDEKPLMGFLQGLLLQVLNAKVIIYGMTLYATYLASIMNRPFQLVISSLSLALLAFSSISIWTLFGSVIKTYLGIPKIRIIINVILALLLVYSAVQLSGLVKV